VNVDRQVTDHHLAPEVHPETPDMHQGLTDHLPLAHSVTLDPGFLALRSWPGVAMTPAVQNPLPEHRPATYAAPQ
jgi:hypothetical protein